MATIDDVRRLALALPRTTEKRSWGSAHWRVSSKGFVWERPLRRADQEALRAAGVPLPEGDVLGVRVADEGVKQALLADDPDVYFTTPHFDGFPAVLVRLERIDADELRELVEEAWVLGRRRRCRAPGSPSRAVRERPRPSAPPRGGRPTR